MLTGDNWDIVYSSDYILYFGFFMRSTHSTKIKKILKRNQYKKIYSIRTYTDNNDICSIDF